MDLFGRAGGLQRCGAVTPTVYPCPTPPLLLPRCDYRHLPPTPPACPACGRVPFFHYTIPRLGGRGITAKPGTTVWRLAERRYSHDRNDGADALLNSPDRWVPPTTVALLLTDAKRAAYRYRRTTDCYLISDDEHHRSAVPIFQLRCGDTLPGAANPIVTVDNHVLHHSYKVHITGI